MSSSKGGASSDGMKVESVGGLARKRTGGKRRPPALQAGWLYFRRFAQRGISKPVPEFCDARRIFGRLRTVIAGRGNKL